MRYGTGATILNEIAEVIGEEATMLLAWEFFGIGFWVSKSPEHCRSIEDAIGEELGARFRYAFHGLTLYLPTGPAMRWQVQRMAATHTRRDIARKLRIPERQVFRILKKAKDAASEDGSGPRISG